MFNFKIHFMTVLYTRWRFFVNFLYYLGRCPDLPRYPDNKAERVIPTLIAPHTRPTHAPQHPTPPPTTPQPPHTPRPPNTSPTPHDTHLTHLHPTHALISLSSILVIFDIFVAQKLASLASWLLSLQPSNKIQYCNC